MNVRRLESDTRMRFFLANNPLGEFIKVVTNKCKKIESKRRKDTSQ
jgi:hypothetical protein